MITTSVFSVHIPAPTSACHKHGCRSDSTASTALGPKPAAFAGFRRRSIQVYYYKVFGNCTDNRGSYL